MIEFSPNGRGDMRFPLTILSTEELHLIGGTHVGNPAFNCGQIDEFVRPPIEHVAVWEGISRVGVAESMF